jgi:uncharacterized GH25 family protein
MAPTPEEHAPIASVPTSAVPVDQRSEVTERDDPELAQAIWVEGRVRFPDDTPVGEIVEIVADGKKFEHRGDYRSQVLADGRFRVAYSKETKSGWLRLDAPHLYAAPLRLRLSELPKEIVLEALVGGEIVGVIVPPTNATDVDEALKAAHVELYGESRSSQIQEQRSAIVDDKRHFDLRGIPAQLKYHLEFDVPAWVPVSRNEVSIEAGKTTQLDLSVMLGARISGRVVDVADVAVANVELHAEINGSAPGFADTSMRHGKVEKDGSFMVRGIPNGKVQLVATKAGFLDWRLDLGTLSDGDVRDAVVVQLDRGNFVAGRVTWPDGKPAMASFVRVEEPKDDAEPWQFKVMADDSSTKVESDGTFRITGLHMGPYEVFAQAHDGSRELGPDGAPSKKARSKGPLWHAHATHVNSDQEGLVLVLQPGMTVTGRVVDDTNAPVTRFSIEASKETESGFGFLDRANSVSSRFEANDGRFEFAGLAEGSWSIVAHAKGFNDNEPAVVNLPGDAPAMTLTLSRCATLSGVVVDASGKPVIKAEVSVEADRTASMRFSSRSDSNVTTNERGEFKLDSAPSGGISVTASDAAHANSKPMTLHVAAGERVENLKLVVSAGGSIRGELHSSVGGDLSGWDISLSSNEGSGWDHAVSDAAGGFVFEHVTAGKYRVQAQRRNDTDQATARSRNQFVINAASGKHLSASVTVLEGETAHLTLGSPPRAPVRVTGTVTRSSKPVADVQVSTWKSEELVAATTAADGHYELVIDGSGPSTFSVRTDTGGTQISRAVTIPEGASYTLDFELASGRIAGRVISPDGKPVEHAWVQLQIDRGGAELSSKGINGFLQTDDNGSFNFGSLEPNVYQVSATDVEGRMRNQGAKYGVARVGNLHLEEGGQIDDIVIHLEGAAIIAGIVRTSSGAPAIGASIAVRDSRGDIQQDFWNAKTDGSGHYRVDGLAPGVWTVSARLGTEVSDESAAARVASGETANVDLATRSGTVLQVIVEDKDGKVVGASISVRDSKNREQASVYYAPDSGERPSGHKIGPLAPGSYEVTATNHDQAHASQSISLHGEAESTVRLRLGGS